MNAHVEGFHRVRRVFGEEGLHVAAKTGWHRNERGGNFDYARGDGSAGFIRGGGLQCGVRECDADGVFAERSSECSGVRNRHR